MHFFEHFSKTTRGPGVHCRFSLSKSSTQPRRDFYAIRHRDTRVVQIIFRSVVLSHTRPPTANSSAHLKSSAVPLPPHIIRSNPCRAYPPWHALSSILRIATWTIIVTILLVRVSRRRVVTAL